MEFTAKPKGQGGGADGSYQPPPLGPDGRKKYCAVLIGFYYIGTQPSTEFKPAKQVHLEWQLFVRDPSDRSKLVPSLDEKGFAHTIGQRLTATLGEGSHLRTVVGNLSGIGRLADGVKTDSREWLGRAAVLDLVQNGDYVNVERSKSSCGVSYLDLENSGISAYPAPTLAFEHWDDADAAAGKPAPQRVWYWLGKSLDPEIAKFGQQKAAAPNGNAPGQRMAPPPAQQPHPAGVANDDIPF